MAKLFSGRVRNILLSVGISVNDERAALVEASKFSLQHFRKNANNCGTVGVNQLRDAMHTAGLNFAIDDQAQKSLAKKAISASAKIQAAIELLEREGYKVTKS